MTSTTEKRATMKDILSKEKVEDLLQQAQTFDKNARTEIINKARNYKGLSPLEAATLFYMDKDEEPALFSAAKQIKERIYGNRIVFFAPLYTSNVCTNNCLYCGFRAENTKIVRKTLTIDEIVAEARNIEAQGHKRILLVCGEDKNTEAEHVYNAVTAIYKNTGIRRINVNTAPLEIEDFKHIKTAGIGTYQLFQETYHRETYTTMHPTGLKSDFDYRLGAMDRAYLAGIDDFGIGVLLGLYDYKFDVVASLLHAQYLDNKYNVGPHTVSIPRLRPAIGSALTDIPNAVSDNELKRIVSIYRLAMPYTGIILSTRESAQLRNELLDLGVSQMSAGSKTSPGGYEDIGNINAQFEIHDERTLDEMVDCVSSGGYLPSFCTACYRSNRTGEVFMALAKDGSIHEFCQPNSILTFKENIEDYASDEKKDAYNKIIDREVAKITNPKLKELLIKRLQQIEDGARDLYF